MDISAMKVVQTVYEGRDDAYVYRVTISDKSCRIARTSIKNPSWYHGILCQMYCKESNEFLPAITVKNSSLTPQDVERIMGDI